EGRGRGQLLVDDLVAEIDALVADVDAGAGDQLLHLPLRLAAEAAEELLVRVCGTCQRNPLLSDGGLGSGRLAPSLDGAGRLVVGVVYGAAAAVPARWERACAGVGGPGAP